MKDLPMTPERAVVELRALDVRDSHRQADEIIACLLYELGLGDVVEAWDAILKQYDCGRDDL